MTPRDDCVLFPANIGEIRGQVYHFSETFYLADNGVTDCPRGYNTFLFDVLVYMYTDNKGLSKMSTLN